MNRLVIILTLTLSGCVAAVPPPITAPPPVSVSVDTFGPYLDPYGAWVIVPGYGRVWQPATQYVGYDFFPYATGGHWVFTSGGWIFESDYPFGWAVFHYGRWFRHVGYGWLWVPGSYWAPAWVSWRTGGPYVGWAPLGPAGELAFVPRHWCFVETRRFTGRHVRQYAVGEGRFHAAVQVTRPVHGAVPVGPPPAWVSAATRTRIDPVPLRDVRGAGRVVPPPPPPGRVTASVPPPPGSRVPPPPPPPGGRLDAERMPPPPPPPGRVAPERLPPPTRAPPPPPARVEPQRPAPVPPPARFERPPAPPPPRPEVDRLRMPPPQVAPPPPRKETKKKYQPAPAPIRRLERGPTLRPPPPPPPP